MDADGRRFHLLLGKSDWERVRPEPDAPPLRWDDARQSVGLEQVRQDLPATPGESRLVPVQRRAAAADRHGNVYAISDDRLSLQVTSAGSRDRGTFWPPRQGAVPERLFAPEPARAAVEPLPFLALGVTTDDWLVATRPDDARGLSFLLFDLVGGGAPIVHVLPPGSVRPRPGPAVRDPGIGLAPRPDGGLFLLDRLHRRLWTFDRTLAPVPGIARPDELDPFQPTGGGPARTTRPDPVLSGLDLAPFAPEPMTIAPYGDALLLLDRSGDVHLLPPGGPPVLVARSGAGAHDMVVARVTTADDAGATRLLVVHEDGNQARAFLAPPSDVPREPTPEVFPLRRFGGRALVAVRGFARYDGPDGVWTPIVEKPLRRFRTEAAGRLPRFDSGAPGTVWDCVVLDGAVPPGTRVALEARAFDDDAPLPAFVPQPRPLLARGRVDLAWHSAEALPPTDSASGSGSHMLLLQGARGRYLELRLRLAGDGSATPRLRTLRAWSPALSWVDTYLPAIYRAEPTRFLDRFLANFQGEFRMIEERIAGAEHLFGPTTAPAETLSWLADWFDVALDPSWDEARQRLFIANAESFFRWRGTRRGLLMALRLAFDPCVDARLFAATQDESSGGIRIVESFQTRRLGPLAAGDPGQPFATRPVEGRWTPAEGRAGLATRVAQALGPDEASGGEVPLFAVDPAVGAALLQALGFQASGVAERTRWRRFQGAEGRAGRDLADLPRHSGADPLWRAFLTEPSPDRERWQQFLQGRYRRIQRLREAHGTDWDRFDEVSLPDHLPASAAAQADWFAFETRILPAAAAAHRFSVLLPLGSVSPDADEMRRRMLLAQRIVALEKPAHTTFDVRFFWAMNRVGEARLGLDTALGQGSRAPELRPEAVLGRSYAGASFVASDRPTVPPDRRRIPC